MTRIERIREVLNFLPDAEYLRQKTEAGWKLASLEWERAVEGESSEIHGGNLEVPFGLRIATDCLHLEEDPLEMQALKFMLEMIVQDVSLSRMAEELNRLGFLNRDRSGWTSVAVFKVLPRVVEVGPRIVSSDEWQARKKELARVAWNS